MNHFSERITQQRQVGLKSDVCEALLEASRVGDLRQPQQRLLKLEAMTTILVMVRVAEVV